MSDWEIVNFNRSSPKLEEQSSFYEKYVPEHNSSDESFLYSLAAAPFRVGEDVLRGGMELARNVPSYLQEADVSGLIGTLLKHPLHAQGQALAGSQEAINKLAQLPLNLSRYGNERLHLLPESVPNFIEKISPEDTTQAIHELFGDPQHRGEAMFRGAFRNIPELVGGAKIAQMLNPAKYTSKSVANNILKKESEQVSRHTERYNNLWKKAEDTGYNVVPANIDHISKNLDVIEKYKTPREYQSLEDFMKKPTLENAQKAQSDMSIIHRNLSKKSRKGSLTSEEKAIFNAAKESEKEIESNMFKNKSGKINEQLKNEYNHVTKSYRENVVPYKYNPNIQAFKAKELTAKELKNRLSRGPFAAQKAGEHPELFRADAIKKALIGLGIGSAILGGKPLAEKLYNL